MAKLKILKTGETDIESTDIWRFCMHSDYPTQKIYASGQTTLTIPAGTDTGTKTISHSLGYAPIVMAMFETDNSRYTKVSGQVKFVSRQVQAQQYFQVYAPDNWVGVVTPDYGSTATSFVSINDVIRFKLGTYHGGELPTPLQPNTDYYVIQIVSSTRFKISLSLGGPELDITNTAVVYNDIMYNITNPYTENLDGTYSVQISNTEISFAVNPSVNTPYVAYDTDIPIYYIILYDQI